MIRLYYRQRCTSSPKAIQWFKKYKLDIHISTMGQVSREEIITVLASTDNGISELIKHPSHGSEEDASKIRLIKTMTLNEAIDYIKVNPNLLRSPIIIEKDKVLIGYNPEQIRMFLPKEYRRKSLGKNTE
ncbi:ArsC/Spx/MgsR family protein [Lactococcus lactis]|uniref:ArsC/Spx/MgsR family protein n=1 Tax=Lactococcus lactis TaxID=1358 RepID=UPI00223B31D3|nr:ArsC/Spx/MgsR family protein [Lactococcus lactis]